jgi:hypothetical protein
MIDDTKQIIGLNERGNGRPMTYDKQSECMLKISIQIDGVTKPTLVGTATPEPYIELFRQEADEKWSKVTTLHCVLSILLCIYIVHQ